MEKTKKVKLIIGLFYTIFLCVFLFFFFSNFTIQEVTSYEFIKDNRNFFLELREKNLFLLGISFVIFTIIWVLAAGFGAPIAIISGFIFGWGNWILFFFDPHPRTKNNIIKTDSLIINKLLICASTSKATFPA